MRSKQIWIAFIACVALVVLWFTFDASYKLYRWSTQTRTAKPHVIDWGIEQQASDRFVIEAAYTFSHKGENYEGSTIFQTDRYRSKETANHFLNEYKDREWTIWYSPFHPQNSTIDRFFPLKPSIYTAIVWGIMIYFIWLGRYLGKHHQ